MADEPAEGADERRGHPWNRWRCWDQLLDHLRKADVVRMMEDKKEDTPQRGSAQRWAVERGMPVMVETGTLMCYGETDEGEQRQRFVERLAVQPELAGFRRCLSLFLAGLPEFDARQPDATALDTLPNTPGCMISVRSAFAVPHQKHRGASREAIMVRASPCFVFQRRAAFDNVAIRCEDTDDDMDCWFGPGLTRA
ncbi:hypothetical protein WJX75_005599 [Coccomyxa subellipsoidea]|uniref:Uncharacterized protein n=1 Tax=Coccomyxa subellipsoidea TaxID=248742 RepID=A0ABR2Z4R3_9CHLO